MRQFLFYAFLLVTLLNAGCTGSANKTEATTMSDSSKNPYYSTTDTGSVTVADAEWKKLLPGDVYDIARGKGTERAFTGKYNDFKEVGTYFCAVCGNTLFQSNGKFESSCGWPSFFEPVKKGSIIYAPDNSHGMERTEVMCGRCRSHLGHVFNDGPPPTGLRYCINSVVLNFDPAKKPKTGS